MTDGNDAAIPLTEGFTIKVGTNARRHIRSAGGMTKREYFAVMAMQGLCANPDTRQRADPIGGITFDAVRIADELIEVLNK